MRRIGLICATAVIVTSGAVLATDSSHKQAARELLRVMRAHEMAGTGAKTMVDLMVQANPKLAPFRDAIAAWANQVLTWEAMAPGLIDAYTAALSETEMRDITSFYQTPAGQKLLDKMPELMQKQVQIGSSLAQARQGELQEMLVKRAKELDGEAGTP